MNETSQQATPGDSSTAALQAFIDRTVRRVRTAGTTGTLNITTPLTGVDAHRLTERLLDLGIFAPVVLAERGLRGIDPEAEAKSLGVTPGQATTLYQAAVDALEPEARESIEAAVRAPKGKGQLPPDHPEVLEVIRRLRHEERILPPWEVDKVFPDVRRWVFLPLGPVKAVDHRPKLGPARDQGQRPTCTSFGATAVAEALEYLRDRRPGPRNLSEEFLWWYSKNGALITGGGYDCRAALYHYQQNGTCPESLLPYSGRQINSNHAHVPIPDDAMDRARDYRQPAYVGLVERDVASVKRVLESGRCVAFASDTHGWNTATGVITLPDPPLETFGAGHCTTIIGYIDRDDLPENHGGGYFIVRNSWGGVDSPTHVMGPEYGGHLLMPYGWYSQYTFSPITLGPEQAAPDAEAGRAWRAEYFDNRSLRGLPAHVETVPDVEFDWGSGGPFRLNINWFGNWSLPIPPFDNFSARFSQVRRMRSGWYRFTLRGDDGLRLWVDDRLVINAWKNQPTMTYSTEHYVTGGDHVLRVEYFEASGLARIDLDIEAINLHYELFSNAELAGAPSAEFDDCMTDLEWRHAPPVATSSSDGRFSLRATGRKEFAAGMYRFHARHTGGCRMWLGGTLVLDDWDGTNPLGAPVTVAAGTHDLRVEFRHTTPIPASDARSYYRAALAFDWAEEAWKGRIYRDPDRQAIEAAGWPNVDSHYEGYRTQSLTGDAVLTYDYSVNAPSGATYWIVDGAAYMLTFPTRVSFGEGIPGGTVITDQTTHLSAHFSRRLYVPRTGRYQVSLGSDEAFRVAVDGLQVLEHRAGQSDPFAADVHLEAGVHDVSFEYADTAWSSVLSFELRPADWSVQYYTGTDLQTYHASTLVAGLERLVSDRPPTLGAVHWSARASRQLWLPVGRFRVTVKADDGVRVKFGGTTVIDAWRGQAPTTYTAHVEHSGGPVWVEVEYFQAGGGAVLEFDVTPDGFLGEYYRGVDLGAIPAGTWERKPPIAYRFEPVLDFDWGETGRLPRIGSDRFSARWWGSVDLPTGRWAFRLTSDDGVRLFLDDRLLIDRWQDQPGTTTEAVVDLAGAHRDLRVEYYERSGKAKCRLEMVRTF